MANVVSTRAQDTYIPVGNYKLYNTATGTTTPFPSSPATYNYAIDQEEQPVFNSAGYLMFGILNNIGTSGFVVGYPNISGSLTGPLPQLFPIPGNCKKYYALSVQYPTGATSPYGNIVTISTIDASTVTTNPATTGYPSAGAPQIVASASTLGYSTVVAPLNSDGTRFIYVLKGTMGFAATSSALLRYAISYTGVISGPITISSSIPTVATTPHISPDGATIAYFNNTGKFTTCNTTTGAFTAYVGMMAPVTTPIGRPTGIYQRCGVVQVTLKSSRRWYANNGTDFGYYVENTAGSFTPISASNAINCTMALGKDGKIYFGQFDATMTDVNLDYYIPSPAGFGTFGYTGSNLNDPGYAFTNQVYSVNSHVEGEDIDLAFTTPTSTNFNINGITSTATSPTNITLCNGATALLLNPSISGAFTNYTITVEKGNFTTVFNPLGGAGTQTYTKVASSFPSTDLLTVLPFLSGYTGCIRVTVTTGACATPVKELFNIVSGVSVTGLNFTVGGQTQTLAAPADVWQCAGSTAIVLAPSIAPAGVSSVTGYTITVEKGSYSGGFIPAGTSATQYTPGALPSSVNLYTLFPAYLASPVNCIKVTLTVNGLCNTASTFQLFDVKSATAAVDFLVNGPSSCGTFQPRNLTPTFTTFTSPVTTPPCIIGWLGAGSCGLAGSTASATGGFSSYNVTIDEYDATGTTFIANVANSTTAASSLPAIFTFNSLTTTPGWFSINYGTIKNNNAFKATVSITAAYCGVVSAYTWFKIIDGGPAWSAGNFFKTNSGGVASAESGDELTVYPIPTDGTLNFEWASAGDNDAQIEITDMVGKVINQTTVHELQGSNKQTVDVSSLPSGMYIYKFSGENGTKTGKFQKL
ncbi:T9SS type A sorting domain-containing protein [Flavipsychrobacter stenotrophus]|nr:T9SS type A sorting domain-containing protein [Flavipsychrobacter stenotrophus]